MKTHGIALAFALLLTTASVQANLPPIDEPTDPGGGGDPGGGDPGGSGGGGGTPPFNPPPMQWPYGTNLPQEPIYPYAAYSCNQIAHVGVSTSNDVARGQPLYLWGVTVPGSVAIFGFYNEQGTLVKAQATDTAHSNCVINETNNAVNTYDLSPGYYTVFANYKTRTSSQFPSPPAFQTQPAPYEVYAGYENAVQMRYITTIRIR